MTVGIWRTGMYGKLMKMDQDIPAQIIGEIKRILLQEKI